MKATCEKSSVEQIKFGGYRKGHCERIFFFTVEHEGCQIHFELHSQMPDRTFGILKSQEYLTPRDRKWPNGVESVTVTIAQDGTVVTHTGSGPTLCLGLPLYLYENVDDKSLPTFTLDLEFNCKPTSP